MRRWLLCMLAACGQRASPAASPPSAPADAAIDAPPDAPADAPPDAFVPPQIDPDGDDDPEEPGAGAAVKGAFTKVGTPPLALRRVCDLTPLRGSLYLAHAIQPLGSDGATITRYTPGAARPFEVAFDWNRRGMPAAGGGAGQGFTRVHAIAGRLFVPDADPPYNGFGLSERGTEGYVFASDRDGVFKPPRPGALPPAGVGVVPRAYHVLDVISFRGQLYTSAGSVPPKERAWVGPSPGALHRATADASRWDYEVDYPFPYRDGVWRLTYMVRYRDRLYVGIQDYDARDPNDFVIFDPPREREPWKLERSDIRTVRITDKGAAGTLRWWVDTRTTPHRLFWIAWGKDGVKLRVTTDGDAWREIAMPAGAVPTDVTRWRDAVVVLTDRGLWRLDGETIGEALAPVIDKRSPFELTDFFCAAPLAVLDGELYAGGQIDGSLYKLTAAP